MILINNKRKYDVIVIGAGPSGVSAAINCAKRGLKVLIVDSNSEAGGQIYRAPPKTYKIIPKNKLEENEIQKKMSIELKNYQIDTAYNHTVWQVSPGFKVNAFNDASTIQWKTKSLIIATGTYEKIIPFEGWTIPGVIGLAACSVMLKSHHFIPSNKIILAGNGPLLVLVAYYISKFGGKVDAIVDTSSKLDWIRSTLSLITNPKNFIDTNIIGTFNLLDVTHDYLESKSQEISKNFKFHHISTDEVFGDLETNESPFTEESSYKPSSPYAASKAASDHLVRAWGRTFKLPIVITNCSNNFGPYQYPEKLIPTIILNALNGKKIPIYGTGKQIRDWLYVEDHVNGLITVMEKGDIGETYMIGGNNELTNIYVAESICSIMDKLIISKPNTIDSFSELITHVADRKGHDIRYAVNCSKISRDLGWAPQYTFELAIERTIKWYIENSSWCNSVSK